MPDKSTRENFEIYCSKCPGWFFVNWDMTRHGKFLFVCPKCKREHARTIREGEMKSNDYEARFIGSTGKIDVEHTGGGHKPGWERILIMASAWHSKPMLEKLKVVPCGFMSEKWLEKTAREKGELPEE